MGMKKKLARLKRAKRSRSKMAILEVPRLCVFRSPRHIYVQLISSAGNEIKAAASSLDPAVRKTNKGNATDAQKVGELIAEKVKALGIDKVAFDRSGYQYHGRVKALADAARAGGLKF
tara:strand:+ start:61 stop:414 length:354 start_codon:yes stop_codon:yes gene_type:complete